MRCPRSWPAASGLALWLLAGAALACGERVRLALPGGGELHYAWSPQAGARALLLLAGGDGRLQLGPDGCAQALRGNSLVRNLARWQAAGWSTALVDAPSAWQGEDGLAAHRASPAHAAELGAVIRDLRRRGATTVWLVGTSRGGDLSRQRRRPPARRRGRRRPAAHLAGDAGPARRPQALGRADGFRCAAGRDPACRCACSAMKPTAASARRRRCCRGCARHCVRQPRSSWC